MSSQFVPGALEVAAGTIVTWTNDDQRTHTVTSDEGAELDSGDIYPGGTYSHNFGRPGTYFYHCSHDPTRMFGQIVVR